ncbi:MAG: response regulator [Anaerolineae bacterium]|nr:response regulator [Anaerolineae bacterium]
MLGGLINRKKKENRTFSVMVVSDTAADLSFVKATLEASGYVVHAASDPAAALAMLDAVDMPDIFIGDFRDPETDGTHFVGKIQVRFGKSTVSPVVFLLDSPEDEEVARTMGVQDILPKPLVAESLLTCVKSILESAE